MNIQEIEHLFTFHKPTLPSAESISKIRNAAQDLYTLLDATIPNSPDKTYALTMFRTCIMLANAAVVLNQDLNPAPTTNS